jgi:hypothetical protein
LASASFVASPLAVFTEADLKEQKQHSRTEPERDQNDREQLTGQAGDERGAHSTGGDEQACHTESQDPGARRHPAKVHRRRLPVARTKDRDDGLHAPMSL